MLKLHHFDRSPFGWKVRLVLAEKKVPHEIIVPENKSESPAFGKLNPFRLTPVLELSDGRTVYESTVINEYLEETYPTPAMLPKDPYERARLRMLEDTTDQYFMQTLREYRSALYEYAPPFLVPKKAGAIDHAAAEESKGKIHKHLARLEQDLAGRTWFGGEIFSLADAALVAPLIGSLALLGILPDPKYPNLAAWSRRVAERPSTIASTPKEPMRIKKD
ncbi:MAG TPA: glutathione S-transferase family protein [Candidatus Polarisedimenticolia bacterium]|nr:glutathione S-transferase family protein [Candidatus Polarisedimenticolia bacterium]